MCIRDRYSEAEKVLKDLQEQYPSDYRFDMQMAYLLIDQLLSLIHISIQQQFDFPCEKTVLCPMQGLSHEYSIP